MNNITIVVPTFKLEKERFENFKFIVNQLQNCHVPIIIVEQINSTIITEVCKYLKQLRNNLISYFSINIDDNKIHKCKLINVGSSLIKTKYLWMLDADCYLKYENVLLLIENQDVIKPFKYAIVLTESETQELFKFKQLHIKKETRELVKHFGPLSFIIKKDVFDSVGKMNESFIGYGWEDLEFANRVKSDYSIYQLDSNALHLYHKRFAENFSNKHLYKTLLSRQHLSNKKKIYDFKNKELKEKFNFTSHLPLEDNRNSSAVSITNIEKLIITNEKEKFNFLMPKLDLKHIPKNINVKKLIEIKIVKPEKIINENIIVNLINRSEEKVVTTEQQTLANTTKNKIIHAIAPALIEGKKELYFREMLAIESIIKQKNNCGLEITNVIISNNPIAQNFKDNFIIVSPPRTALEIGDKRDLVYLSDIFKVMNNLSNDETILFYTNSDCCISEDTYPKLLKYDKHAIEYHRNDVLNNPKNLKEMFINETELHKTGVDGLAFTNIFYKDYKQYVADFFIGEPHWDTAVGGFLRNFDLSIINTNDLYHIKHGLAWDTKHLTIAGEHNTVIYKEFLEYGFLKSHILTLPDEYMNIDTNVVIVHFGTDPIRVKATTIALSWLDIQELPVEYIFVEMVYNDEVGAFEYLKNKKNFKYIKLNGNENNKVIWQKESMMNIGAKQCTKPYVIFLDSDVYSKHSNWFNRIRNHLELNKNTFLQVFKLCTDSIFTDQIFVSAAAKYNNFDTDLPHNPGLGIAVCNDVLIKNNYFNFYCIYGGGDSCILSEYCQRDAYIFEFDKLKNVKRNLSFKCELDYIDEDLIHENHGRVISLSYYSDRHEISKLFTKEIKDLVTVDNNGLLVWDNINCEEKQMIDSLYKKKFK
jgi:predicted glycosyltransferase involved in capsule biosynthesis